jgi:hypothetical protein
MKEVPCRSGKYRQFEKEGNSCDPFYVGTKGAVRTGKCATKSISVSHLVHPAVKNWEKSLVDSPEKS